MIIQDKMFDIGDTIKSNSKKNFYITSIFGSYVYAYLCKNTIYSEEYLVGKKFIIHSKIILIEKFNRRIIIK
jgi:hypothetical protein